MRCTPLPHFLTPPKNKSILFSTTLRVELMMDLMYCLDMPRNVPFQVYCVMSGEGTKQTPKILDLSRGEILNTAVGVDFGIAS